MQWSSGSVNWLIALFCLVLGILETEPTIEKEWKPITEHFLLVKSGPLFRVCVHIWRVTPCQHCSVCLYRCIRDVMYVLKPLCDCALTHFHSLAPQHCNLCPQHRDHEPANKRSSVTLWAEATVQDFYLIWTLAVWATSFQSSEGNGMMGI